MERCCACGKIVLLPSDLGNAVICNACASKINFSAWKKRNFKTYEELVGQKSVAIQLAKASSFFDAAIKAIEEYFDSYINAGYVTMIDGEAGQTLKIFADYCMVETKNDAKRTELIDDFCNFLQDNVDIGADNNESLLSIDNGKTLVKGLLSGRIVQTGLGVAAATFFDSKEKEDMAEKRAQTRRKRVEQLIFLGEHKINLHHISNVDICSTSNATNGYLRFVPVGVSQQDYYSCAYFFFNNSKLFGAKKFKQSISSICDMLNDKIINLGRPASDTPASPKINGDVFDEIRKFKELFDEGIITEKEFNMKKKRLLGL